MPWYLFALASALLIGIVSILEKKILMHETPLEFSSAFSFYNFLFTLPLLFFIDLKALDLQVVLLIGGVALLGSLAFFYTARGVQNLDVSLVSPLRSIGPATTAILAVFFLNESLAVSQWIGMGAIVIGSYILSSEAHQHLLDPLKRFFHSRSVHFILIAVCLYSVTAVLDRSILHSLNTEPLTYIFVVNAYELFFFLIMSELFSTKHHGIVHGIAKGGFLLPVTSIAIVLSRICHANAVKLAYIGLAEAVKRSSALFVVIVGGRLFHEKNVARRTIATIAMIVGILFVIL